MAETHKIEIAELRFPPNSPIATGDTVVWTNRMQDAEHTVTADDGRLISGTLKCGDILSHVRGGRCGPATRQDPTLHDRNGNRSMTPFSSMARVGIGRWR